MTTNEPTGNSSSFSKSSEYRVVWRRDGFRLKTKRYARLASAERHLNLLTSDEPWRYYPKPVTDPDERWCCDGRECGCCGETERQRVETLRATLPPLVYARIEERIVGPWTPTAPGCSGGDNGPGFTHE